MARSTSSMKWMPAGRAFRTGISHTRAAVCRRHTAAVSIKECDRPLRVDRLAGCRTPPRSARATPAAACFVHRFPACSAQGTGVAMLCRQQVARCGKAVSQLFPCVATGAVSDRAVQEFFGLRPLLLMTRQPRQCQQQARAVRIRGQPALRTGAARIVFFQRQHAVQAHQRFVHCASSACSRLCTAASSQCSTAARCA